LFILFGHQNGEIYFVSIDQRMTDVTCDRRYGILGSTVVRYSPADSVDTNDERDSGNWLYAGICCLAGRSGLAVARLTVVR